MVGEECEDGVEEGEDRDYEEEHYVGWREGIVADPEVDEVGEETDCGDLQR